MRHSCGIRPSRSCRRPRAKARRRCGSCSVTWLPRAEGIFRRWEPRAIIIRRHVPGIRIGVLSALSGILGVPDTVFIPCFLVPVSIWAAIFPFPAPLVSWTALGLIVLVIGYLEYEH